MRSKLVALLFLFATITSCSKYQKVLKSTDLDYKYEMALKYYQEDEYFRALPLFEELISLYRGTKKAEEVYYYYAYCNYNLEDYMLAGYYFRNFAKTYPNSEHTEECQFMNAYCYFLDSPIYSLDQTNTYKAMDELQLFINMYPQSSRVSEGNELIDELRLKLEMKSYKNAKLYYNIRDYKAAIVALNNTLKDFPDTEHKEEITFLIVKSNYLMAINSIESKKEKRLYDTITAYNEFINSFAEGEYVKEAKSIYEDSRKELNMLNQKNL